MLLDFLLILVQRLKRTLVLFTKFLKSFYLFIFFTLYFKILIKNKNLLEEMVLVGIFCTAFGTMLGSSSIVGLRSRQQNSQFIKRKADVKMCFFEMVYRDNCQRTLLKLIFVIPSVFADAYLWSQLQNILGYPSLSSLFSFKDHLKMALKET